MNSRIWIEQSGVIPVRKFEGEIQILLITSSTGRRWGIPKGYLEPDMTPAESAANEAHEEAGALGKILGEALGSFVIEKSGQSYRVEVFLLEVTEVLDHWEEEDIRDRKWYAPEEAMEKIELVGLRSLVRKAVRQYTSF